jgi:Ni/Co efflux regulator RcnB
MSITTKARLLIAATIAAAALTPVAASAQRYDTTRGELRRDRQDIRDERRDLNRAYRNGDRRDVRDAREDYREAQREYNEDRRDYRQERGYGRHYAPRPYAPRYHGPRFSAPFRYRSFGVGVTIGHDYWGPRYRVAPHRSWGLAPAGRHATYVRHYDDLLLVNTRTGRVIRVYRNFYW